MEHRQLIGGKANGKSMLNVFQKTIERLRDECLGSGYEMFLEADVSGWLFHLLLTEPEVNPLQIHLDTRVCKADGRFDIAIGPLQHGSNGRPCIQPQIVVEVKIFPRIGFTDQQHRVHYKHVLNDDLQKLGRLDPAIGLRAALILDGRGYLEGTYQGHNRGEYLISRRNQIAPGVHIYLIRFAEGNWQIQHSG